MAYTNFHPAPGNLGTLLPGMFTVPNNPIEGETAPEVSYTPRIGELIGASFTVPQNPVLKHISGGGDCGCKGGDTGMGGLGAAPGLGVGLGALDLNLSMGNPLVLAAGALAAYWLFKKYMR